jgi:hypothetical protein
MNRFEQAVYDCMKPTAKLLERTTKPLHRAILPNFWRHVHLEGAGEYDRILASDMIVDHPVYRVTTAHGARAPASLSRNAGAADAHHARPPITAADTSPSPVDNWASGR